MESVEVVALKTHSVTVKALEKIVMVFAEVQLVQMLVECVMVQVYQKVTVIVKDTKQIVLVHAMEQQ